MNQMSNKGTFNITRKVVLTMLASVCLEMTDSEMMMICPDCPKLIPLNDPKGLKSIYEALTEFNKNSSNEHVYVLQEVGRIQIGVYAHTSHTPLRINPHALCEEDSFVWVL